MSKYWASDVNVTELETFAQEMGKSDASSGDFRADYNDICANLAIIPCSFVSFDATLSACKFSNCAIDLPAWRAAMIACGLGGSPVKSVVVHHCTITQQHITDLLGLLDKKVELDAVKIDNCEWGADVTEVNTILGALISTKAAVPYISFKYNGLDDSFVSMNASALSQNVFLRYLNLSNNAITDEGLQGLITGVLRCNLSLQKISLKNNLIEGNSFTQIIDILFGSVCTPEEDAAYKVIAKAAADKNKQIKDINKKRKKANEAEMSEIEVPERVVKIGKTDLQLINKTVKEIDVSWNNVSKENTNAFVDLLVQRKEQTPDIEVRAISRSELATAESLVTDGFSLVF